MLKRVETAYGPIIMTVKTDSCSFDSMASAPFYLNDKRMAFHLHIVFESDARFNWKNTESIQAFDRVLCTTEISNSEIQVIRSLCELLYRKLTKEEKTQVKIEAEEEVINVTKRELTQMNERYMVLQHKISQSEEKINKWKKTK